MYSFVDIVGTKVTFEANYASVDTVIDVISKKASSYLVTVEDPCGNEQSYEVSQEVYEAIKEIIE